MKGTDTSPIDCCPRSVGWLCPLVRPCQCFAFCPRAHVWKTRPSISSSAAVAYFFFLLEIVAGPPRSLIRHLTCDWWLVITRREYSPSVHPRSETIHPSHLALLFWLTIPASQQETPSLVAIYVQWCADLAIRRSAHSYFGRGGNAKNRKPYNFLPAVS